VLNFLNRLIKELEEMEYVLTEQCVAISNTHEHYLTKAASISMVRQVKQLILDEAKKHNDDF